MKNDSDPSFSQELAHLPFWDRAFWLSRSYIEASQCLCASMLEGDFTSQYSSSRVIIHLARHGVELFLKAAISAATGRPAEPGHNLARLFLRYRHIYPDLRFFIEIPSRFQVDLNFDLFPETIEAFHATLDQRHRYPADRNGNDFASPEVFNPTDALAELKILEWCEIRPHLGSAGAS
jgi:hypothetical protein